MTDNEAIMLYRREKDAYLARTAGIKDKILDALRASLARDEGGMQALTVSEKGAKIARDRFAAARAKGTSKGSATAAANRKRKKNEAA